MTIISAHRERTYFRLGEERRRREFKVIIAGAGKAAHLPSMCAAIFPTGDPASPEASDPGGVDSLYSIVQTPATSVYGGYQRRTELGILAAKILAASDGELLGKLKVTREPEKRRVVKKAGSWSYRL